MDITAYTYCEDKNMESYLVLKRDVDAGVGVKFVQITLVTEESQQLFHVFIIHLVIEQSI